jgi:hypothetical protein
LVSDIRRSQGYANDGPIPLADTHDIVVIDRLMCAVKGTYTKMNTTCFLSGAIIGWLPDVSRQ